MPVTIVGEHLPTEVGYDTELQSGQDPGEGLYAAAGLILQGGIQMRSKVTSTVIICLPGQWESNGPTVSVCSHTDNPCAFCTALWLL